MDDKITIIEGPTPQFETTMDGWAVGLNEGPALYDSVITRLRTFNGPALVERCHRAWKDQSNVFLHYRNRLGLEERIPIVAARSVETSEGHMLLLWCRRKAEDEPEEMDENMDDDANDSGEDLT